MTDKFSKIISELTVCSYNATYALQSESTIYGCLNDNQLLAHLAKWLNFRLRVK